MEVRIDGLHVQNLVGITVPNLFGRLRSLGVGSHFAFVVAMCWRLRWVLAVAGMYGSIKKCAQHGKTCGLFLFNNKKEREP